MTASTSRVNCAPVCLPLNLSTVERIGAVAERGTNGVEAPGGGEQLRDGAGHEGKLSD